MPPPEELVSACSARRCRVAEKAAAVEERRKHKKNLKVLSFGDDVEEDDGDDWGPPAQMRSAHDAIKDPRWGTFGLVSVLQSKNAFPLTPTTPEAV